MKKLSRQILTMLSLLLFMSSQSIGQSKWAPVMMDDIIVMVPYGSTANIKTNKSTYLVNENITAIFSGMSGDAKDWIGIYPKGKSTDWGNVVTWEFTEGKISGSVLLDGLTKGEYDVRAFFKNGYDIQASTSIKVVANVKASMKLSKKHYAVNETISVRVENLPGNNKDWVGIYKKNDNNEWKNVKSWKITHGKKNTTLSLKGVVAGYYEARLFFNNTYKSEAIEAFTVGNKHMYLAKTTYGANETIKAHVVNLPANKEDWIGIYRKSDNNDWGNVIKWNFTNGTHDRTKAGIVTGDVNIAGVPAGEYEARLFYNNTFKLEDKVAFSIRGEGNYGEVGDYKVDIDKSNANYNVFIPKNHTNDAPIVLYLGAESGLHEFFATKGVIVIGSKGIKLWDNVDQGYEKFSSEISKLVNLYDDAISKLLIKYPNINPSKLGVIGKSISGGVAFTVMKSMKSKNYGLSKSFVISLDGSFAHMMSKADLNDLQTDSLFMQFDGYRGDITDPRRLLTINKLLPNNTNKGFEVIPHKEGDNVWAAHGYSNGTLLEILKKPKLVSLIGALVAYEFFNDQNAKNVIFNKNVVNATIKNIKDHMENPKEYLYNCDGTGAMEKGKNYSSLKDINYCQDYK